MPGRRLLLAAVTTAAVFACAPAAWAARPPNDNRANAAGIRLGQTVNGTTVGSTVESLEPPSGCGPAGPSVWYRLDVKTAGRVITLVSAHGDLDVVVDVFRHLRSQVQPVSCDMSDQSGRASTDFRVQPGESFFVRVAQQTQSGPGDFSLTVGLARPAARPPGTPLGARGRSGSVQRVFEPSNAWSTTMLEGRTYRLNLASGSCLRLSLYPPGTSSFEDEAPVRSLGCRGYALFTPGSGESGRYSLLVEPGGSRAAVRYHLQVGLAGPDDTTPGHFIRNHAVVRGRLNANRLDVVDLYRFDVTRTSITALRLDSGSGFFLRLITERGRTVASGEDIAVRTRPGRYYAVVRAARGEAGRYRLSRASRTITRTHLGVVPSLASPGGAVSLRTTVSPAESGPVVILVERFDPLAGYQFMRTLRVHAVGGHAAVGFLPPSVGFYRARATFVGTRDAATSGTGWHRFKVQAPLTE
jgi:hypothetical protein